MLLENEITVDVTLVSHRACLRNKLEWGAEELAIIYDVLVITAIRIVTNETGLSEC